MKKKLLSDVPSYLCGILEEIF